MAIGIELWVDGRLVGGTEAWWDRMEIALADRTVDYPRLNRVDPYGDVVFTRDELEALTSELRAFMVHSPEALRPLVTRLNELCVTGLAARDAELRFMGD